MPRLVAARQFSMRPRQACRADACMRCANGTVVILQCACKRLKRGTQALTAVGCIWRQKLFAGERITALLEERRAREVDAAAHQACKNLPRTPFVIAFLKVHAGHASATDACGQTEPLACPHDKACAPTHRGIMGFDWDRRRCWPRSMRRCCSACTGPRLPWRRPRATTSWVTTPSSTLLRCRRTCCAQLLLPCCCNGNCMAPLLSQEY